MTTVKCTNVWDDSPSVGAESGASTGPSVRIFCAVALMLSPSRSSFVRNSLASRRLYTLSPDLGNRIVG